LSLLQRGHVFHLDAEMLSRSAAIGESAEARRRRMDGRGCRGR
jgi:hypothetical protein